jgi:hypothetical protein
MTRTRYWSLDDPDASLAFDHGRVDWMVDVLWVAVHEAARVAALAAEHRARPTTGLHVMVAS